MECWLEMGFLGMVVRKGNWREEFCEYHFVDKYVNLEVLDQEVPLQDFGMEGMIEFWTAWSSKPSGRSSEHALCLGPLERMGLLPWDSFFTKFGFITQF